MTQLLNSKKSYRLLLIYWLFLPILFYLYVILSTFQTEMSVQALIQQSPLLTIGILNMSLLIFQAAMLCFIHQISESRQGLLGKFTLMAMIQQLLTGNIIGVALVFFLRRSLLQTEEETNPRVLRSFYLSYGVILLLSVLILVLMLRLI